MLCGRAAVVVDMWRCLLSRPRAQSKSLHDDPLAAGSISTLAVGYRALAIGNPPADLHGHAQSWARLPLFVCLCAAAKLVVVPGVLLLIEARRRLLHGKHDG